ncbi:b(0,+)-type amino acid transporter 1-like isoform X1 [Branchiostoma lanceolatum]|uniref:b(0,+)-type amino acid transporter 1-like isoform X1 n=1 Tax=Branchiostoma lanceolatum TaxID=7740 RepID=UPI0034528457
MSGEDMEMKHRVSDQQNGSITAKEPPGVETMQLKKRVGLFSGVALIVGTMIGSGIFVSPKGVLREVGGVGPSLLVWTGCGVISMMGALTYAELGTMITESGGEYAYLFKAFGPIPAFLFQWTNVILLKPSSLSAIALSFAIYVGQPFYPACVVPDAVVKFLAAVCIVLVTALNCISVKVAARIQVFFTAIKVLALGVIIGVGIYSLAIGNTLWLTPDKAFQTGHTITISDVGLAFYQGLWAYDGWNNLNFVTEEIENPVRNLPLAIMISIPLVTLLYVLANVAYFSVMTPSELLASGAVAVTLGNRFLGVMSWVVPFAVVCSTFGACNGSCFAASRLCYTAARKGHMVEILSMIHVKLLTPSPALIFNSLIALIMIIPNDFDAIINYFSFAAWMFYGATCMAHIVMRFTQPDAERPIRTPVIFPALVVVASLYLIVAPIISEPDLWYLYAAIFILAGLLFYFPFVYFGYNPPFMKYITMFLQLLMNVSPPTEAPKDV